MDDSAALLGPDGPLARRLPSFRPRPQQQAMAAAIGEAIDDGQRLILEAGTGTGKTYAYLVPALVSGARVIISTGTRTLQEQLYHHDLPRLREHLRLPLRSALLKGRANYLCPLRLERSLQRLGGDLFPDPTLRRQLNHIQDWARQTRSGDIAELPQVPEESPVWSLATSTSDNCLGTDCPHHPDRCPLYRARQAALEAELVVVNHHLLLAHMALEDEGFGRLLPEADAHIVDEAHQLPKLAGVFFGDSLSSGQLVELARDAHAACQSEAPERHDAYRELAQALPATLDRLRERYLPQPGRYPGQRLPETALAPLQDLLEALHRHLEEDAQRGPQLSRCRLRCERLRERLRHFQTPPDPSRQIRWLDVRSHALTLHETPLDVGPAFRRALDEHPSAWIFVSATLTVGGRFDHYQTSLGLHDARTAAWDSPFDYPNHALLLCPEALPEPGDSRHTAAVVAVARTLIDAADGRTFLLFTSHRALQEAALRLRAESDRPLLVQGEGARARLLERFREHPESVLLGTNSFWEGVDVQGTGLSCVVIDKLPFPTPGDPVVAARAEALKRQGRNPFQDYFLPEAVTALRQGAGRLIRGEDDRGVLAICDPRLVERPYGRLFLDSLPPMRRTRRLEVARRFLSAILGDPAP